MSRIQALYGQVLCNRLGKLAALLEENTEHVTRSKVLRIEGNGASIEEQRFVERIVFLQGLRQIVRGKRRIGTQLKCSSIQFDRLRQISGQGEVREVIERGDVIGFDLQSTLEAEGRIASVI